MMGFFLSFRFQSLSLPLSSVSKFRHSDNDYDDDDEDDDEDEDGSDLDPIDDDAPDDLDSFDDETEDKLNADNINNSIPANSTIVTSVLHLNNVDHSDAGRYQCIVSNKFGATYSHRFKVSVACKSKLMRNQSRRFLSEISIKIFDHSINSISGIHEVAEECYRKVIEHRSSRLWC